MNIKQLFEDIIQHRTIKKDKINELLQLTYFKNGLKEIIVLIENKLKENDKNTIIQILYILDLILKNNLIYNDDLMNYSILKLQLKRINEFWNIYEDYTLLSIIIVNYTNFLMKKIENSKIMKQINGNYLILNILNKINDFENELSILLTISNFLDILIIFMNNLIKTKNELYEQIISDLIFGRKFII